MWLLQKTKPAEAEYHGVLSSIGTTMEGKRDRTVILHSISSPADGLPFTRCSDRTSKELLLIKRR